MYSFERSRDIPLFAGADDWEPSAFWFAMLSLEFTFKTKKKMQLRNFPKPKHKWRPNLEPNNAPLWIQIFKNR